MTTYATVDDLIRLWRPLQPDEQERAAALLSIVSASLRQEADKVGRDLDSMVALSADLAQVARSVTVDVVARTLMTSTSQEPLTQFTQSAGGYSASGTYLVPGVDFLRDGDVSESSLRSGISAALASAKDLTFNSIIVDTVYYDQVIYHSGGADPVSQELDMLERLVHPPLYSD